MAAEPLSVSSLLNQIWAKSPQVSRRGQAELLTEHSQMARDAARALRQRVGFAGVLTSEPRFWYWAEQAAFLHDTGKIAAGFQRQLRPGKDPWGHRHEILSLAYVDLLLAGLSERDKLMIATGVAFHHRPLTSENSSDPGYALATKYSEYADWQRAFGCHCDNQQVIPSQGASRAHAELTAWLADKLEIPLPAGDRRLWERARDMFAWLREHWQNPVDPDTGLFAVLLQGAVTLADHASSADVPFQRHMPLAVDYLDRLAVAQKPPHPHQRKAGDIDGHLVLVAPTGSGKTEAGLAWAARQLAAMPGEPRLVWVLPYRASINAAADRFATALIPAPGEDQADIGILHATTAQTLLGWAVQDAEDEKGLDRRAIEARKARARASAMKLFCQRIRVSTPHQLLRAAIAGPKYSSLLLEQTNCLFVLDELHAYDPVIFGRICAAMRLWGRLGSRVAVVSATLAPPLLELIAESLGTTPTLVRAPRGTAPDRHRLILDEESISSEPSLNRIVAWLRNGLSVLVVANTVATAQALYRELAPIARDALPHNPDAALLLHSRFRANDRARIESRILRCHPERKPGDSARRHGGLVVATQALEVSLCLDFDRGVSQAAPVEAVAQRMGRVNRRGLHPEGAVEFRVHRAEFPRPYGPEAVEAAWSALSTHPSSEIVSEATIDQWLAHAYDTPWGHGWADQARDACERFRNAFLIFTEPFADRTEYAHQLDEQLDGVEVLLSRDEEEYRQLTSRQGDYLLAAGLLISIRYRQKARLEQAGRCDFRKDLGVHVVNAPYDETTGLDLSSEVLDSLAVAETIL